MRRPSTVQETEDDVFRRIFRQAKAAGKEDQLPFRFDDEEVGPPVETTKTVDFKKIAADLDREPICRRSGCDTILRGDGTCPNCVPR